MQDIQFAAPLPILGIAATVGGYTVMEAREDLMTCRVTEGLTEDAVTARLHEGGYHQAPHVPLTTRTYTACWFNTRVYLDNVDFVSYPRIMGFLGCARHELHGQHSLIMMLRALCVVQGDYQPRCSCTRLYTSLVQPALCQRAPPRRSGRRGYRRYFGSR